MAQCSETGVTGTLEHRLMAELMRRLQAQTQSPNSPQQDRHVGVPTALKHRRPIIMPTYPYGHTGVSASNKHYQQMDHIARPPPCGSGPHRHVGVLPGLAARVRQSVGLLRRHRAAAGDADVEHHSHRKHVQRRSVRLPADHLRRDKPCTCCYRSMHRSAVPAEKAAAGRSTQAARSLPDHVRPATLPPVGYTLPQSHTSSSSRRAGVEGGG